MLQFLMITEIVISAILMVVIVLQPKEGDGGVLFGGGFAEEVKRTKRGAELFLHNLSIVLAILWTAIAVVIMFLSK
jgi:protein translocase SecG subunit